MTESTTYQGYANYPTWAICLWIDNEEPLHDQAHEMARQCRADAPDHEQVAYGVWTEDEATRFALADDLKEWVADDLLPELDNGPASDLLQWAFEQIDWHEVADHYLAD